MPFTATQVTASPDRVVITIPGSATTTGATLQSLLATAGISYLPVALKILGKTQAGADRAAFLVASPLPPAAAIVAADFDTRGQFVAAGADYYEPSEQDYLSSVRAVGASAITATVVVFH